MAESRKPKPAVRAEAPRESYDDVDLVIKRIVGFLDSTSENPIEDANRINSFVIEYLLAQRPSYTPSQDASEIFKDEPMPKPSSALSLETADQPEASPELQELLYAVVDDPRKWLVTPSAQFGGRKPGELVGTDEEHKLFDLLHAVEQGMF